MWKTPWRRIGPLRAYGRVSHTSLDGHGPPAVFLNTLLTAPRFTFRGGVKTAPTSLAASYPIEAYAFITSLKEYVSGQVHTNGVESFWSLLKRRYYGTYHKMSVKHLQRYVTEFSGRHNVRQLDTIDQMGDLVAGMLGRRLMYRELIP